MATILTRPASEAEEQFADPAAALERVGELLSSSDFHGARALLRRLKEQWPDSPRIEKAAALILEPPKARLLDSGSGRDLRREFAWLRAHAREYPGCWVAVSGDDLSAADPDLKIVRSAVRAVGKEGRVLLHCQPPW